MSKVTAERVSTDGADNYVFQRCLVAYVEAEKRIGGQVLEIGTGSGYGIDMVAPKAEKFVTVDKFKADVVDEKLKDNIEFRQLTVPPLSGIADNSFDYVITFQVIEHIKKDAAFTKEIYRVLKRGGKLLLTTPNIKTTLTRNPWHIREYTVPELEQLLLKDFEAVEKLGVFGNEKVQAYITENKKSIKKITRFDIFNLQYNLPRQLLQIPYDILNRRNRKKMLKENTEGTTSITVDDFFVEAANDECLDLFYIATKNPAA